MPRSSKPACRPEVVEIFQSETQIEALRGIEAPRIRLGRQAVDVQRLTVHRQRIGVLGRALQRRQRPALQVDLGVGMTGIARLLQCGQRRHRPARWVRHVGQRRCDEAEASSRRRRRRAGLRPAGIAVVDAAVLAFGEVDLDDGLLLRTR